jgi:hypothetical protein
VELAPSTQRLIYVILAIALVLLSALPIFDKVSDALRYLATLLTGAVLVTKPGDAPAPLVDIVSRVAASLSPPPNKEG